MGREYPTLGLSPRVMSQVSFLGTMLSPLLLACSHTAAHVVSRHIARDRPFPSSCNGCLGVLLCFAACQGPCVRCHEPLHVSCRRLMLCRWAWQARHRQPGQPAWCTSGWERQAALTLPSLSRRASLSSRPRPSSPAPVPSRYCPCALPSQLHAYLNNTGFLENRIGLSGRGPSEQHMPATLYREMLPNEKLLTSFESEVSVVCVAGGPVAHSSWSASCSAQILGQGQTVCSEQPGRSGLQQAQPVVGHRSDCTFCLPISQ